MADREIVVPEVLKESDPGPVKHRPVRKWWDNARLALFAAACIDLADLFTSFLPAKMLSFLIGAGLCGFFCWQNKVKIKRWPWWMALAGLYCGTPSTMFFPIALVSTFIYQVNLAVPRRKKKRPTDASR